MENRRDEVDQREVQGTELRGSGAEVDWEGGPGKATGTELAAGTQGD